MPLINQLIANGLIAGAIYALIAAGFSLVFNILKFFDLSPGAIFVFSAFTAYTFSVILGFNLILSFLIALVFASFLGILINKIIYRPLRKGKATNLTLLLASFGIFLFIEAIILLFFGAEVRSFGLPIRKGYEILGAVVTPLQLVIIFSSLILLAALLIFMKKSKIGKALRAMADNKEIASTLGINIEKAITITFIIAALLAATAGFLGALEHNLDFRMGLNVILKGITASIVGGIGNVPAALVGGFFIGLAENFGILFLPSGYKDAIAFAILIIFLLFRPQGIFGVKTREEQAG